MSSFERNLLGRPRAVRTGNQRQEKGRHSLSS